VRIHEHRCAGPERLAHHAVDGVDVPVPGHGINPLAHEDPLARKAHARLGVPMLGLLAFLHFPLLGCCSQIASEINFPDLTDVTQVKPHGPVLTLCLLNLGMRERLLHARNAIWSTAGAIAVRTGADRAKSLMKMHSVYLQPAVRSRDPS
jgi:hypothetical protein